MNLAAGSRLGPYQIVSQLGSGGMGVVYKARDPRLKRTVAIKLLPPDLTRDETAKQRFLQEAQAASALDHPNICTIFEINETADGQLYLVMAHYEGETLKERISKGALELDDAIDIAKQVGEGLAEAHGAGIVHRDIKPANLLITKTGVVKILDFGLAKLAGAEGMTQTGTTLGTVAYMSPEQAKGEEVDHRTDIWSLGVVLYEMLAGQPPFQGKNYLVVANAIAGGTPRSLTGPAAAAQGVLERALNKQRSERHSAAADLLDDLQRVCSLSDAPTAAARPLPPDVPSIAVLPFADMSPEKDQDYFCEGMAEEIINALTKLENLKVASRTSAFQFKDRSQDIRTIGEALNVNAVLEGSVRTAGKRLRVMAELINMSDGYHLWSERYDRTMDDVFDIQDEIAHAIAEALKIKLLDTAVPKVARHTADLDAYHLYLQGRHHWSSRYRGGLDKAARCFELEIEKDPSYPLAHAGLAHAFSILALYGHLPPRVAFPRAKAAVEQALRADPPISEAHTASGMIRMMFDWNWPAAEAEFRQAVSLNPSDPLAFSWLAFSLCQVGRHREAIAAATKGQELDPLSPYANSALGLVLHVCRKHDQALEISRRVLEREPQNVLSYFCGGGVQDSFQQIGPLARYVEDLAFILPLIAGPDFVDPGVVAMPLGDPKEVELASLRIGFHTDNGIRTPTAETQSVVRAAATALMAVSNLVDESRPPGVEQSFEIGWPLYRFDGGAAVRRLLKRAGTTESTLGDRGTAMSAEELDQALAGVYELRSRMLSYFTDHDVFLCPVNAHPAVPHGSSDLPDYSYTITYNVTGWPGAVVRGGASPEGLPIGVQIIGPPGREDVVLAVAAFVEQELGGWQPPAI